MCLLHACVIYTFLTVVPTCNSLEISCEQSRMIVNFHFLKLLLLSSYHILLKRKIVKFGVEIRRKRYL